MGNVVRMEHWRRAPEDPLAPAKGCAIAVLLGILGWLIIAVAVLIIAVR